MILKEGSRYLERSKGDKGGTERKPLEQPDKLGNPKITEKTQWV